MVKIYTTRRL